MEIQSTAYEYLPVPRASTYTEKKQCYDGSACPQNESPIKLTKGPGKGEMVISSEEDEFIRPPLKLRNSRLIRLSIFLVLEAVWLAFGLVVYWRPIPIPSGDIRVGTLSTSTTSFFEAALGSIGILWQSLASLTIVDLIQEIYSGDIWILQARHAFRSGHSTLRYKFAFIISLLLIALSALAPNAINISSVSRERTLMIGAMNVNITEVALPPLNMTYGQLLLEVVQFDSVVQLDGSLPEFVIKDANGNPSSNVLFGMPLRSDLGNTTDITRLSYTSDSVFYDFKCQWLSPEPIDPAIIYGASAWSFGGDMTGFADREANLVTNSPRPGGGYFGIWPLNITDGAGALNGSFAWFISSFRNHSDFYWDNGQLFPLIEDVFVDLSSIPGSRKTFGNITYSDLDYIASVELLPNTSTTDTVLFCDPHIKMGSVEVDMSNDGSILTFKDLEGHGSTPIGNIGQMEVSQILGRGLNGIPWDPNVVVLDDDGAHPSTLGRLTAELPFLPPEQASTQLPLFGANGSVTSYSPMNQTVYSPQSLSDISSKLNSHTSIAGMNTYLSGSLGNYTVPTTGIYATQRLVVNWPQWFANLFIVMFVASFVMSLTIRDAIRGRVLVPLTVTTMKRHLFE